MSLVAVSSSIQKVTDPEFIVECESRPLSEHIWAYFEFSYDKYFTKPELWLPKVTGGAFDYNSFPGNRNNKRFEVKGLSAPLIINGKHETFSGIVNGNVISFDKNGDIERVDTAPFDDLIIPNAGIIDLHASENGVNYYPWTGFASVDLSVEDYDRAYMVAGLITHVRATPTTPIIQSVPTPPKPGDPIYVRMRVARV